MRGLLRSLLAALTLGMTMTGCNKTEAPAVPTDITLHVPGMH